MEGNTQDEALAVVEAVLIAGSEPTDIGMWELTATLLPEDEGDAVATTEMSDPVDIEMLDILKQATDDIANGNDTAIFVIPLASILHIVNCQCGDHWASAVKEHSTTQTSTSFVIRR